VMVEVAADPVLEDWLVHAPSHLLLDLLQLFAKALKLLGNMYP